MRNAGKGFRCLFLLGYALSCFLLLFSRAAAAFSPGEQPMVLPFSESSVPEARTAAGRPNILVILADDLGWADLGCYGNAEIITPHLDRFAQQGMRFTDAYAPAPICSPSRAAILTGKSPAQLHFEFVTKPDNSPLPEGTLLQQPSFPRDLPLEERSLAEILDSAYISGFYGKWHLTQENDHYLGWGSRFGPLQQGFDTGTENRGSHPYAYSKEEKNSFGNFKPGSYPQDSLTEAAIDFIKTAGERPFLLYYSMYYVHTPVQTRLRWLYDKYKTLLGPGASEKQIHYAAFVETMDVYIGQLLEALEASGQAGNTLVIFTSDNGGHPYFTDNGPLRGSKWNLYEGGIRVPMIARWPGKITPGSTCTLPVTGMDIFSTIAAVAGTERTAFAASEQSAFPGSKGVVSQRSASLPGDGRSLLPLFQDPEGAGWERSTLYWHFPFYHPPVVDTKPQSAIREGRYKLIYFYETQSVELYDLKADPGENRELQEQLPDKARQLTKALFRELKSVNARLPKEKI